MAGASAAIYYSPLNGNCRFFSYMNSIPEEDFRKGMLYVIMESMIQLGFTIFLFMALKKKLRIDVFRVGNYILRKNISHYWSQSLLACMYFIAIFLQHRGSDNSMEFEWLGKNASTAYITAEAQGCQMFNFDKTDVHGVCASDCTDWCEGLV